MYIFPIESPAIAEGLLICADKAKPPSPPKFAVPVPANL
jgi:hypothetical protein